MDYDFFNLSKCITIGEGDGDRLFSSFSFLFDIFINGKMCAGMICMKATMPGTWYSAPAVIFTDLRACRLKREYPVFYRGRDSEFERYVPVLFRPFAGRFLRVRIAGRNFQAQAVAVTHHST